MTTKAGSVGRGKPTRCSLCHEAGHNYGSCPQHPDRTVTIPVPADYAELVIRERLRPVLRACVHDADFLRALMFSCYLQGALDGQRPEVKEAMEALGA